MEIKLDINRVSVVTGRGCDKVFLTLNDRTAFPIMGYNTSATIEVQAGLGQDWCREYLMIIPEVINTK